MLMGFLVVVGGLGFYKYRQISAAIAQHSGFKMPPTAVTALVATTEPWEKNIEATGSFSAYQGVTIAAEEPGKVVKLGFESASKVKAGDILVQIDTSVEEADLKAAEARFDLSNANNDRMKKLAGTGAMADREMDDVDSQVKQMSAQVDSLKAKINRKTIRAPFDGQTGIRQVQLGQYVVPGDPIVSLQTMDPIYVNFELPQQDIDLVKSGQKIRVNVDTFGPMAFEGTVSAVDPQINEVTRMVRVQGTFANAKEKLRPGMYCRVTVLSGDGEMFVTLPITAIARAPYGDSVFVIQKMKDPKGLGYLGVKQEFVKTGARRGDQVAVISGVKAGDQVATSGLFKLQPGAEVLVNNEIIPQNSETPKPQDN